MNLSLFQSSVLAVLAAASASFGQTKIVIKGSDTLGAKMVPQLAAVYKDLGNPTDFEIAAEGSSTAFTSLLEGTADIGMSSRDVKGGERDSFTAKGMELIEYAVGVDMLVVVVNEGNSIRNLTKRQVEGIFTGEIRDWSEVGGKKAPISVYTRNTSSGTYRSFQELAMDQRDYGSSTQKMAGNEAIASEVSKNPHGIGYVGLAYIKNDGILTVTIDGMGVEAGANYPYARQIFFYTVGRPEGELAKFLNWTARDKVAHRVIEKVGFLPIAQESLPQ